MAQYTITHQCGHEQTHNITGPDNRPWPNAKYTRREWIAQQRAKDDCGDCKSKARDEQRGADTLTAVDQATAWQLPVLTGSEKQTAWAERIRRDVLNTWRGLADRYDADIADNIFRIVLGAARRQTTARWWIDHDRPRHLADTLAPAETKAIEAYEEFAAVRTGTTLEP